MGDTTTNICKNIYLRNIITIYVPHPDFRNLGLKALDSPDLYAVGWIAALVIGVPPQLRCLMRVMISHVPLLNTLQTQTYIPGERWATTTL